MPGMMYMICNGHRIIKSMMVVATTIVAGNFHDEKIFQPGLVSKNFVPQIFVLCQRLHSTRAHGDLYHIGENLLHRIFLQYRSTWAWRNFCPASYTVFMIWIPVTEKCGSYTHSHQPMHFSFALHTKCLTNTCLLNQNIGCCSHSNCFAGNKLVGRTTDLIKVRL